MSDTADVTVDRIRAIDLFSDLSESDLERVASLAQARDYEQGTEILHQEEWPEDLIALEDGEVEVRRGDEVVATLKAGCIVGERGVLRRALRNADVIAATPVKALFFHRNKVTTLRHDLPEIEESLQAIADEREG
jgi:CRP/FNR family transcriptional regulator, cyclic AMP receptor protein